MMDELLDERPASWATPQLQVDTDRWLRESFVQHGGAAVVYATHSVRHARLADVVLHVSAGRIKQSATPGASSYLEWRESGRR